MPRLVWVLLGAKAILLVLSCGGSIYVKSFINSLKINNLKLGSSDYVYSKSVKLAWSLEFGIRFIPCKEV